jgi:hypothetical protein
MDECTKEWTDKQTGKQTNKQTEDTDSLRDRRINRQDNGQWEGQSAINEQERPAERQLIMDGEIDRERQPDQGILTKVEGSVRETSLHSLAQISCFSY